MTADPLANMEIDVQSYDIHRLASAISTVPGHAVGQRRGSTTGKRAKRR